jgi:hypothetical protein
MKGKSGSLNRNTSSSGNGASSNGSSSGNDYKSTLTNTSAIKNEPAKAS